MEILLKKQKEEIWAFFCMDCSVAFVAKGNFPPDPICPKCKKDEVIGLEQLSFIKSCLYKFTSRVFPILHRKKYFEITDF